MIEQQTGTLVPRQFASWRPVATSPAKSYLQP